nr:polyphenol oxidase I, chloroplastic-like [Tanacetum cinerariifolium]
MSAFSLTMASATTTTSSSLLFSKSKAKRRFKQTHGFRISCSITSDDHEKPLITTNTIPKNPMQPKTTDIHNVDRRDMLLGLGGLYSTVNLTTLPSAFAVPIKAPSDISTCHDATSGINDGPNAVRTKACCPLPSTKPVKDFVNFPRGRTRTRPAAHKVTSEYLKKFNDAMKAMRDLPDEDPRSFKQQAMIHCAYCNGGYTQIESGHGELELQIHNSWLFFPFHRWYLFFFERILGKLINDPTFALPYWNWDNPAGMEIPQIYEGEEKTYKENALFDGFRNAKHLPPSVVDLGYDGKDRNITCLKQVSDNLSTMYKEMISNAFNAESFFGGEYRAGDNPIANGASSVGSIERGCHTAIHRWVGNPRMPNDEDMGNFYSAGYDPLFYAHHANVDRMWTIWKELSHKHREPKHEDWLNASYVFYDENKELVRVYNKDCVKIENLQYNYERSDIPWAKSRPTPRSKRFGIATRSVGSVKYVEEQQFPLKVDGIVKVLVKRPSKRRSKEEKEEAVEMLLVNGIEFDGEKFVKFDVIVNDDESTMISETDSEFAGTFAQLPHNHTMKMMMTSGARFGLNELLEEIEAEDDEFVLDF